MAEKKGKNISLITGKKRELEGDKKGVQLFHCPKKRRKQRRGTKPKRVGDFLGRKKDVKTNLKEGGALARDTRWANGGTSERKRLLVLPRRGWKSAAGRRIAATQRGEKGKRRKGYFDKKSMTVSGESIGITPHP